MTSTATDTCVTCQRPFLLAYEIDGNPRWVDLEPVPGGDIALVFPREPGPDTCVTLLHGVGPGGDPFFGLPAGAPRYRLHDCARRAA